MVESVAINEIFKGKLHRKHDKTLTQHSFTSEYNTFLVNIKYNAVSVLCSGQALLITFWQTNEHSRKCLNKTTIQ